MLIGIIGKLGSGKTLTMTYLLLSEKVRNNRKVATNYWVAFADNVIRNPLDIENLENCAIGLDDLHLWLEAAHFDANKVTTIILKKSRERGINIYFTTLSPQDINARLRRGVNLWILPKYVSPEICYYTVTYPYTRGICEKRRFRPRPIFALYNTKENTKPPSYFEFLDMMRNDPEVLECITKPDIDIDVAADIIAEKYPLKKKVIKELIECIRKNPKNPKSH